jgi:hypothetical protein
MPFSEWTQHLKVKNLLGEGERWEKVDSWNYLF